MKMHQVQVPMVELNRCTEMRKKHKIKVSSQQVRPYPLNERIKRPHPLGAVSLFFFDVDNISVTSESGAFTSSYRISPVYLSYFVSVVFSHVV